VTLADHTKVTAQADLNGRASHSDAARKAFSLHEHLVVSCLPAARWVAAKSQQDFQAAISTIAHCRQPVIAAIAGNCLGLGIDIAAACDIRLAAEGVKMAILVRSLRLPTLHC
jgi:enoyl-CoA hydratase/carnithine racemase